jgi:hypothetical protein
MTRYSFALTFEDAGSALWSASWQTWSQELDAIIYGPEFTLNLAF